MAFENNFYPQDNILETAGVKLVIDPTSLMYMQGSEIDYVDSLMGAGLRSTTQRRLDLRLRPFVPHRGRRRGRGVTGWVCKLPLNRTFPDKFWEVEPSVKTGRRPVFALRIL